MAYGKITPSGETYTREPADPLRDLLPLEIIRGEETTIVLPRTGQADRTHLPVPDIISPLQPSRMLPHRRARAMAAATDAEMIRRDGIRTGIRSERERSSLRILKRPIKRRSQRLPLSLFVMKTRSLL